MRLLNEIHVVCLDLCEHGLCRNEHDRAFGRFATDDVLLRDILDVLADIGLELALGGFALRLAQFEVHHALKRFQRKLRVDRHIAGRLRQKQHAVDDFFVRKLVLKREMRFREDVADQ